VYGFNSTDYAYFVIVQKKSHLPGQEDGYVTRLARSCITDANYDSYTEVTLQCVSPDGSVVHNLLQDAKVTRVGAKLAESLGLEPDQLVLVGVFSPSKGISSEAQANSAMCVYSLSSIETKFNENIHMCFNGSVTDRNMGYISGPVLDGRCPAAGVSVSFVICPVFLAGCIFFSCNLIFLENDVDCAVSRVVCVARVS
jgi:plexin A